jgi:hypothetical protein
MDDLKPLPKQDISVLEDRRDDRGEAIAAARNALVALPVDRGARAYGLLRECRAGRAHY